MLSKNFIWGALLALAPIGAGAQELVFAEDPENVASLMQDLGYKASLGTDNVGDPLISSSAHGYDFDVLFYDCTDNTDCKAVQFSAAFDLTDGMSLTKTQDFNRERRWVKVYLNDESDPRVEMDYNLRGGVTVENFNDTFDWWLILMEEFVEYIDF